jgi:SAM-dependent methyltransferase
MDERTVSVYNSSAAKYCERWEKADSSVFSLLPHLFSEAGTVLEIGFGSGRDLAFLKEKLRLEVYGVEASEALLRKTRELHPELRERVYHGFLPGGLPKLPVHKFDGILLAAVFMHIPDEELFQSALQIRELLNINGRLVLSVPVERTDITGGRDGDGRLMLIRPISRIKLLFERLGFEVSGTWESSDALGRSGIRWATLVFSYRGGSVSESVDKIESIINRDRKTATYKLALLKALCDIAQIETNTVSWDGHGNVHVPVDSVVRKWMEYYWPVVSADKFIPQTRGEHAGYKRPIAFRHSLTELAEYYRDLGGLQQFVFDRNNNKISSGAAKIVKTVRRKIRTALINGPVYYAGGGDNEDKPFDYNTATKSIVFHADIWREFVLLGHWIGDSINIRWAELTRELSRDSLRLDEILHLFLVSTSPERNVSAARELYLRINGLECVWTGRTLSGDFDVDHAIPFSLRHDNSLWNLFPADSRINNRKRDKLPTRNLVEKSRDILMHYWEIMNEHLHEIFVSDFRRFTGLPALPAENWKHPLYWSFTEAVETTAARRGAERWEP